MRKSNEKRGRKIIAGVLAAIAVAFGAAMPVVLARSAYANDGCVETSIIQTEDGKFCDTSNDGQGIYRILNIVVNVLTMGVGVLGTLGIVISGIQYMSASGNEAQMAKAKKRIFEVVIGLVVFGVMWVVMQFLIPGGVFG